MCFGIPYHCGYSLWVAIRSACVGILMQSDVRRRGALVEEIMCKTTLKGLIVLLLIMF